MSGPHLTPGDREKCDSERCAAPLAEVGPRESLLALIAKLSFFKDMEGRHLELLADLAMRTQIEAGHRILRKGDPANRFYIILHGSVVLESPDDNGEVHCLQRVGAGDVLGWSWLFPPYYWHFDAVAAERTDTVFFYGTRLREECNKDPVLGYELMKRISAVVIDRLQAARKEWIQAKQLHTSARL